MSNAPHVAQPPSGPLEDHAGTAPPAVGAGQLRIGGLTRLTTIDYPGELAAVVFCQGCPWRCRYCQNGDLLSAQAEGRIPWADIARFLTQRIGLLDGVVFSGGEPTAQTALAAAMAEAKALGYKVGLHTSGAYPERLQRLLRWVDWVGLDIKALPDDYAAITGVAEAGTRAWQSLELLLNAGTALEVRTTLMPDWTPTMTAQLAQALADAGVRHYCLQSCVQERVADPALAIGGASPRALAAAVRPEWFASLTLRGATLAP